SRRIARLEMYIAASAGYLRSAVALAAEETGEVSSLTGKVVRQPDLLSDLFWLGGCIRDYDRKKNRSYAEEVLKKRLKFNMVTAQTLDEERRLHGVDLVDKDWDVIRDTFKDMFGKSKRPGHADSGSHDEIA
ncbi:MAG TPA: hypothetical protein VL461_04910, partial [Dictyobacter sp.]|nr:hypothetical protein [Dictyobacter sp.]